MECNHKNNKSLNPAGGSARAIALIALYVAVVGVGVALALFALNRIIGCFAS